MPIDNSVPAPQQEPAQRAQASWRANLLVHPAAEMFPLMSADELTELGADIIKNGLTSPIVLWSDGKSPAVLLDGRNRLDALEIATGSPVIISAPSLTAGKDFLACGKVIVLDRSVDPYSFVISANIHRRHLSPEQKRDLIAKLIKATPGKSDRQIAETVKASPTTVGTVRAEMEATGDVSLDTRTDTKGRQQPARKPERKPEQQDDLEDAIAAADADPEVSAAARAAQHDDQPSEWEWKPKCLAHLPVAHRLEMLVGLLQDGLTPVKDLIAALQIQANASVTTRSKLEGLEAMAGHIFTCINVVRDEVAGIKQQLVAYEQRGTADDGLDMPRACDGSACDRCSR